MSSDDAETEILVAKGGENAKTTEFVRRKSRDHESRRAKRPNAYLDDMEMDESEREWWGMLEKRPTDPVQLVKRALRWVLWLLRAVWATVRLVVRRVEYEVRTLVNRHVPWLMEEAEPWEAQEVWRTVRVNFGSNSGEGNALKTSKYGPITFLPKFLFEQYRRISNIYFTIIMLVNFIPGVSPIIPITSVIPLAFVLGTAAIKELLEDTFRHISDYRINSEKFHIVGRGGTVEVASKKLRPGDIVRIDKDQAVPADMVLLSTSDPEGAAFVTTANLDGETNLKQHKATPLTALMGDREDLLRQFRGMIKVGPPDKNLYHFDGKLVIDSLPIEGQDEQSSHLTAVRVIEESERFPPPPPSDRNPSPSLRNPSPSLRNPSPSLRNPSSSSRKRSITPSNTPQTNRKRTGTFELPGAGRIRSPTLNALTGRRRGDTMLTGIDVAPVGFEYDDKDVPESAPVESTSDEESGSWATVSLEGEVEPAPPPMPGAGSSIVLQRGDRKVRAAVMPEKAPDVPASPRVAEELMTGGNVDEDELQRVWPLDKTQLLLRGSQLRNTKHAYGVVVYAGKKTKLFLNLSKPPSKFSSIDRQLNLYVLMILIVQQSLVGLLAIGSVVFEQLQADDSWYLGENQFSPFIYLLRNFLSYFVLFNIFVPISLWVTLEVVRTLQARFIAWDYKMKSADGKAGPEARTANLNEDLGMIDFVFSDKTGTLTANIMEFRNASVGGEVYGAWEGLKFPWMGEGIETKEPRLERVLRKLHLSRLIKIRDLALRTRQRVDPAIQFAKRQARQQFDRLRGIPMDEATAAAVGGSGLDVDDRDVVAASVVTADDVGDIGRAILALPAEQREEHPLYSYMRVITLCHDCMVERDGGGEYRYSTPSPDEKALVEAARANGFFFAGRRTGELMVRELGKPTRYELLATLAFTSSRKRMTSIVRYPNGELWLLAKGANNVMYDRMAEDCDAGLLRRTDEHVRLFASTGLRTLVMCQRRLDEREYAEWRAEYDAAASALEKREEAVERAAALIERDWYLVGCSAIEDRLQDEVPETIYFLRQAGIQVWVLTGDMLETAKYIGYSSRLLDADSDLVHLAAESSGECGRRMIELIKSKCPVDSQYSIGARTLRDRVSSIPFAARLLGLLPARFRFESSSLVPKNDRLALILDGKTLEFALNDHLEKFKWIGRACKSVICCRVSPLQKARVVEAVRKGEGKISLAIGDGANDVSMIQKAHVGVGIFGKEGTQAARSADYAIHTFKHLRRLLSVHGRYNYLRSSGLIQYSFFKNIAFTMPFLFVSFFNGFTGTSPYDSWVITFFNTFFTALPPGMYGIWERDVPESACEMYPQLYRPMHQRVYFNKWTFLTWILQSIWVAAVVYFLFFGYYWGGNNVLLDGRTGDLFSMGFSVSFTIIIVVNLRMALEVESWNWIWFVCLFGTMLFTLAFQILWSLIYNPSFLNIQPFEFLGVRDYFNNTGGVALTVMATPFYWLMLLLTCIIALLPILVLKYIFRHLFPAEWVIASTVYHEMRKDVRVEGDAVSAFLSRRERRRRKQRNRRKREAKAHAKARKISAQVETFIDIALESIQSDSDSNIENESENNEEDESDSSNISSSSEEN